MTYQIKVLRKASRQLKTLPKDVQSQIRSEIRTLSENPRPPGVKKLSGAGDFYRIRVGNYRIIYEIQDKVLLVLIVGVGHRREIYRGL